MKYDPSRETTFNQLLGFFGDGPVQSGVGKAGELDIVRYAIEAYKNGPGVHYTVDFGSVKVNNMPLYVMVGQLGNTVWSWQNRERSPFMEMVGVYPEGSYQAIFAAGLLRKPFLPELTVLEVVQPPIAQELSPNKHEPDRIIELVRSCLANSLDAKSLWVSPTPAGSESDSGSAE